jgi:hypothetical protein
LFVIGYRGQNRRPAATIQLGQNVVQEEHRGIPPPIMDETGLRETQREGDGTLLSPRGKGGRRDTV